MYEQYFEDASHGKELIIMAIQELQEKDLIELSGQSDCTAAVLFYTPFCGTCQIAERMLEIVHAAGVNVKLYKANINFTPKLRDEWQISSVPCLVLLQDGKPLRLEYAMRSVDHIYNLLKDMA
jgi:thioredoxin-like negative regulator of GroEL